MEDTYLLCPAPVLREVGMYVFPALIFTLHVERWVWVSSLCSLVLFGSQAAILSCSVAAVLWSTGTRAPPVGIIVQEAF